MIPVSPSTTSFATKVLKTVLPLGLSFLLLTAGAGAADVPFYVIAITDKDNAVLFSEAQRVPEGDLPYALVDRAGKACCFKAGTRPGARKPARKGDGDAGDLMSEDDKPLVRHAGYLAGPAQAELELAYGFQGMRAVTRKGRDTYQVTLGAGSAPVFVRSCYTGEGLRLRLFHQPGDKKPYASYYYYLGYEVEPTCRQ